MSAGTDPLAEGLGAAGLTNAEIIERSTLSARLAKRHVNRTLSKLDPRHRSRLVTAAYESGALVPAGDRS